MANTQAPAAICYEQPLNERTRTLLRLEFLFEQGEFGLSGDSVWHTRIGVQTLSDLLELGSRGDLRSELTKELDRFDNVLTTLQQNPGVDQEQLQGLLDQTRGLSDELKRAPGLIGGRLKQDELLNAVLQRTGIAGGTCAFDLPSYHRWLNQPAELRQEQLQRWLDEFTTVRAASAFILQLYRQSARPRAGYAEGGRYQTNLERGLPYQMIQVRLPADSPYFPEISGSKHFFNIRFMEQSADGTRPVPSADDVEFRLLCCVI